MSLAKSTSSYLRKSIALISSFLSLLSVNAENVYEALIVGFVSGAGSTGTNQIIKQLFQKKNGGEQNNETSK